MPVFRAKEADVWIRLETLVILRWIAVAGQVIAVVAALALFGLHLPLGLVCMAIGALIVANLVSATLNPQGTRLSAERALGFILFDVSQLVALLALTGGLSNPFVTLMLAPVAIGAAILPLPGLIAVVATALLGVSLLEPLHAPLRDADGTLLEMAGLFRFGVWLAAVIGTGFLAFYARRVATEYHAVASALSATQLALAREQKLTDLGGVVAAAAHELGTPLATIKMVSAELADLLEEQPELAEDARLIRSEADRCRDIMRSMGQAGKDDTLVRQAPFQTVIEEAAEPHRERGIDIRINLPDGPQPQIVRAPEIIHGMRNLIQNAVDYAEEVVTVDLDWGPTGMCTRIKDDGPGFPPGIIDRLGDPFLPRRRDAARPGYEGMGLGLFIARTLLERSGASMRFANGTGDRQGAIVEVRWPRSAIEVADPNRALGENPLNDRRVLTGS